MQRVAAWCLVTAAGAWPAIAQPAAAQSARRSLASMLAPGAAHDSLVSTADSTQRYAVFLPDGYTRDRRWPVVFLLDPRGRALVPLTCFRDAAARLGYILVSSYGTRSDGAREPNDRAMDAMTRDVERHLAADLRRFYFAGFSGTTRFAWDVSGEYPSILAGIIGVGAGLPGDLAWLGSHVRGTPFAYFGAVGSRDPNYEEMRALDSALATTALPHTLEVFDGGHEWPPPARCARALEWMEADAMRRQLRPADSTWARAAWAARLTSLAGDTTSDAGRHQRWQALRAFVAEFDGVAGAAPPEALAEARAGAARLEQDRGVAKMRQRLADFSRADRDFAVRLASLFADMRTGGPPVELNAARRRLALDDVRRAASGSDSLASLAAHRKLNRLRMHASFYEPRTYIADRDFERAKAALRIAEWIDPADPGVCLALAGVLAQLRENARAFASLTCALRGGVDVARLESDSLLAPLRALPEWREALRSRP